MLKLADITSRGNEEAAPKFTVRLPATPVVETPPTLPSPVVPKPRAASGLKLVIGNKGGTSKGAPSPSECPNPVYQ